MSGAGSVGVLSGLELRLSFIGNRLLLLLLLFFLAFDFPFLAMAPIQLSMELIQIILLEGKGK